MRIQCVGKPQETILQEEHMPIKVSAYLGCLTPEDVTVECLVGTESDDEVFTIHDRHVLKPEESSGKDSEILFSLDFKPSLSGLQYYKIRMYPNHRLLSHPFETGCMIWV